MARKPRVHFPGAIYHVYDRGNGGKDVFQDAMDYQRFLDELSRLRELGLDFIAYCLMPNHFHLLVRVSETPLCDLMQAALSRYAQYFNFRRGTYGHVFQGRYRAEPIDSNAYLLNALRYIHLNPVTARLVERPEDWKWSSHSALLGGSDQLVKPDATLSFFGDEPLSARERYLEFVSAPAQSIARLGALQPAKSQDLGIIAVDSAQLFRVTPEAMRAKGGRGDVSRSRRLFVKRALDCGYRRREIAQFLGCHPTAVSKILSRGSLSP